VDKLSTQNREPGTISENPTPTCVLAVALHVKCQVFHYNLHIFRQLFVCHSPPPTARWANDNNKHYGLSPEKIQLGQDLGNMLVYLLDTQNVSLKLFSSLIPWLRSLAACVFAPKLRRCCRAAAHNHAKSENVSGIIMSADYNLKLCVKVQLCVQVMLRGALTAGTAKKYFLATFISTKVVVS